MIEEAYAMTPKVALSGKATMLIQEESFQASEISASDRQVINPAPAVASIKREENAANSSVQRSEEIAIAEIPASKAQERGISQSIKAVLVKTATQAQDGYSHHVVSGMTTTKAQDTQLFQSMGAVLEKTAIKAQDERISQLIDAVLGKTAAKAQDIEVGIALLSGIPVTMQELLSWIKKLRISSSARSFSPAHTTLHAPASVDIQELLTWIPRIRLC